MLFCCILSILALILLGPMALFSVVSSRESVFLLRFPFLNHVFSCEMLLIRHLKRCFSSQFYFLVIAIL